MQLTALFRNLPSDPERAHESDAWYACWRRQTEAVAESYRSWRRAPRDERRLAYADYVAALDREEHAACAYRRVVERT